MTDDHVKLTEVQLISSEFGLPLEDCFKHAVSFYKEHITSKDPVPYDERIKLMALSKQVQHGPFTSEHDTAGWFNITGNDVNKAWSALGSISREEAMASFVFLVDRVCPPFKGFIGEKAKAIKQIQDALNAQTFHQFSAYAQQQFPGQPEQQTTLIRQLQEQHYQQYMSQVYSQQATVTNDQAGRDDQAKRDDDSDLSDEEAGEDLPSNPAIAPASLWNRQDINEFKQNIKKDGTEGIIKVGHGETVTIRVPTHEEGSCLFWEFATDYYDIGFGVYFEWTIADSNQVSIHVSESDDEDDYEEGGEDGTPPPPISNPGGDVESGAALLSRRIQDPNKPRQDEIIPVYRRDCHEEVYAGSHRYPGRGVYLLKFDNSYSLWRSKTLYYRVYYSK
ncbi:unnamed protein product [Caenorhabditis bovis]|uniref:Golgi resident protein GCP60 n=1 Tax=Caenorhabditis bovis TaxID=2654633 RepID=A0A8S1FA01_9PELO|nr:unnamed protein product [Caenorhabditis bovis]